MFTENIEERVREYIAKRNLLREGSPVVVALSGGADSVALLAVLRSLGYDCRAAHCNYHLRGEESQRDMRHAADVAAALDSDIYIRDFDVETYRKEHGGSVEMACRDLRYAWFADLLDREGAQAVAVGHHSEDRAETFMLNLLRGTGIAGLTSMRPRSGNVVRPLLPLTRGEIVRYLSERGLGYVDDSSNSSSAHRRNRLRNTILPAMEEAFPGAMAAILRTVTNLEAAEAIYRSAVESKTALYRRDNSIDVARLSKELSARTLLFEILAPMGFSLTQVDDILANPAASGLTFMSTDGKVAAELSRGFLELTDASRLGAALDDVFIVDPRRDITTPVHIWVSNFPVENFVPEPLGARVAYFDASVLDSGARWELRHPRRGDRMVPFGSTKSKLLSDIFAAAKFTAAQKRSQWVLTCGDDIVWLPGLRNSALLSVGPDTRRYIRMFFFENNEKLT